MGVIAEVAGERRVRLRGTTVLGRGRRADTRLDNDVVSGLHASIAWRDGRWQIKDLGSHNGTVVNGARLTAAESVQLFVGSVIWFGSDAVAWRVTDVSAPEPIAHCDGVVRVGEAGMLMLESDVGTSVTVFRSVVHGWRLDTAEGVVATHDGDTVTVGASTWTLELPEGGAQTRTNAASIELDLSTLTLRFSGGVRATLAIEQGHRTVEVGQGPHVELLRLLARARATDDGWKARDDVISALGMSANHLNVAIHRARKRMAEVGVEDAVNVVERRRGQLRLGCSSVVLH